MENERKAGGRTIAGILVIAAGILILLNNLHILPYGWTENIFSFPTLLIVIGLLNLIYSRNNAAGIILLVIGAGLLIPRIYADIEIGWNVIFPVIIIFIGANIIFRHRGSKEARRKFSFTSDKASTDVLDEVFVFGGSEKSLYSQSFKGGEIVVIFGGSEINLSHCKMEEDNTVIEIVAVFGGMTLIVPSDWNVTLNVTPIFGGFSNKVYRRGEEVVPGQKNLIVKGIVVFGGGEIKYR